MKTTKETLKALVDSTSENEWPGKLIARWESISGKHYFNLYFCAKHGGCYNYDAIGAGGGIEAKNHDEAIWKAGRKMPDHQPDANKTPMSKVL